ncbi:UV radiation resistance-associated protein [Ceratocystis lukuohia]|uniref:Autophagy-related protein 14 n=1 Tax=Ceratocystis lukuohia TaxID=2019550 RepID=A0ABR4MP47_9PEZI
MAESRSVLLAENRKLRHLRGVYLRNLTFEPFAGITHDDSVLTLTKLKAKGKLRVTENGKLPHARSSDDLIGEGGRGGNSGKRRRSTSGLGVSTVAAFPASASPSATLTIPGNPGPRAEATTSQQKNLQMMIGARLADVFFSLHCEGEVEPVYISEVIEKRMNFNFQFFDLKHHATAVSRSPIFTLKLWTRRQNSNTWIYLLENQVDLRSLTFIPALENYHFPANALIFHLNDGCMYTFGVPSSLALRSRQLQPVFTSSYAALMKLCTLENSIQDAQATQQRLSAQIDSTLSRRPQNLVALARERAERAAGYLEQQRRAVANAKHRVQQLKQSITKRSAAMEAGKSVQMRIEKDRQNAMGHLSASQQLLTSTKDQIRGQRRRICSDLSDIFQISQIPDAPPLAFQIHGVPLPNTVYDTSTSRGKIEEKLSAALGLVAQLVNMLQFYLGVPILYPVNVFGSRSSIRDEISLLPDLSAQQTQGTQDSRTREFPLYLPRGGSTTTQFRFDYGWFLLNKNIEMLCGAQGLRIVDIRHTLPNLQYLLYVCSAGSDELPERKKGGIRGLWIGRQDGRVSSISSFASLNITVPEPPNGASHSGAAPGSIESNTNNNADCRRGSTGSEVNIRHREDLRRRTAGMRNTSSLVDIGSEEDSVAGSPQFSLPFDEGETKLTLRTKGMRENVAG